MANEWTAGLTPVAARELRVGFDDDAEVYERTRPVCPPCLYPGWAWIRGWALRASGHACRRVCSAQSSGMSEVAMYRA